jgi:hypothetical protein
MRRALVFALSALALVGAACGSGDGDKTNASSNDEDGTGTNSVSVNAATLSGVCGGREAVAMGAGGASASQSGSGSVDYNDALAGLKRARDAAPKDIKDDFGVLVEAETPFFQALAKANGNYMSAAQDPAFQEAAQKLSTDEVRTASQNITNWFTEHCS